MMLTKPKQDSSGLVRIVMIKSGQADYVEIEPHSSVHLVGDNGIGKSMILATIQFLMIDDWNRGKMKLSNGALKDKEFYFPNSNSYVIFELESIEGVRHLYVIRGLGKTNNFDIEKWAAEGCWFNEGIFIENDADKSRIRSWDEIRDNLLKQSSSLQKISNKPDRIRVLKTWMGWFGKSKKGDDFSDLYLKFLKLGSIKESELKEHIISSSVPDNMTKRIDISEDYSRTWREIVEERANLQKLKSVQTKLSKVIEEHDELVIRKNKLSQQWINYANGVQKWADEAEETTKLLSKEKEKMKDFKTQTQKEESRLFKEREFQEKQYIEKEIQIRNLEETELFAKSFDISSAESEFTDSELKYEELSAKLGSIKNVSSKSLKRKLIEEESKEIHLKRIVFDNSKTLFSSMKDSGIDEVNITNAFRILDSNLLSSEGTITNITTAKDWIAQLSDSIENDQTIINGIRVSIEKSKMNDFNIDNAKINLKEVQNDLLIIREQLKAIDDNKPLLDEKELMFSKIIKMRANIDRYKKWNEFGKDDLLNNRTNFEDLKKLKTDNQNQIDEIKAKIETIDQRFIEIAKEFEDLNQVEATVQLYRDAGTLLSIENIPKPEEINIQYQHIVLELRQLHSDCTDYNRKEISFDRGFFAVQAKLGNSIAGFEREDFISEAREKLDGIDTLQTTIQDLWFELSNNISGTADDLLKSLREVERKVQSISSSLKKKKITNIEEIHISIAKDETKVKSIIKAASGSVFNNFESKENRAHFREMEKLFEEKPSIDLLELFNLDLHIKKPGDIERRKIGSIDKSGSEGQITAIKSHLLMILLSDVLGKNRARIPIFLDETGKLGSSNYKQILDMSKEVNIQIMTASPYPVEYAERQHPIIGYGEENRLKIRPEQHWSSITDEGNK